MTKAPRLNSPFDRASTKPARRNACGLTLDAGSTQ